MERNTILVFVIFFLNLFYFDLLFYGNELDGVTTLEEYFLKNGEDFFNDIDLNKTIEDESEFSEENFQIIKNIESNIEKSNQAYSYEINKYVEYEIDFLINKKREFLEKAINRASNYLAEIRSIIKGYDIPEEFIYLPIIESGFNYRAYSRVGAAGMWQFMYRTALWIGMRCDSWIDERLDPMISCHYAIKYLIFLYKKLNDWDLALASYNCGIKKVERAIKIGNTRNIYELIEKKLLPRETRHYVPRFAAVVHIMKNLKDYGFELNEVNHNYQYIELPVTAPIRVISKYTGLTNEEIINLNPSLKTPFVPSKGYKLRLTEEAYNKITENLENIKKESSVDYIVYYVRNGDTISEIANRYGISYQVLMNINGITNINRIWVGQKLYIPVSYRASYLQNNFANRNQYRNNIPQDNINKTKNETEKYHIVKYGETLSQIAQYYRISVEAIAKLNNLSSPYIIYQNQRIRIK